MKAAERYRIQAVAEMTGIPAATLRAWERRYGFPTPARTASSYRIYSDSDVQQVRRMQELCKRGVPPSEAARIVISGNDVTRRDVPLDVGPFAVFVERILDAVDAFDPQRLDAEVRAALILGSAVSIYEHVLEPALLEIGMRWHRKELTTAQEHLASEVIGNTVREMLRLIQPGPSARRVLLACFPEEDHVLPLYGFGFRLAQWGFQSVILGARMPTAGIRQGIESIAPVLVGLSATMPPDQPRKVLADYATACGATPWLVGGSASEAIAEVVHDQGGLVAAKDCEDVHGQLMQALSVRRR